MVRLPGPDVALVDELADVFVAAGYEIRPLVRAILVHDEFYSEQAMTSTAKTPVDFALQLVSTLSPKSSFEDLPAGPRADGHGSLQPAVGQRLEPLGVVARDRALPRALHTSPSASRRTPQARTAATRLRSREAARPGVTDTGEIVDGLLARFGVRNVPAASRQALIDYVDGGLALADDEWLEIKFRGAPRPDPHAARVPGPLGRTAMRINRRQFLKGASASAVLASSNVLALARRADAATADGHAIVLINLSGGNDYLNMVIPLDDGGAPQRSTYESGGPDLAIPLVVPRRDGDRARRRAGHQPRAPPADDGARDALQEGKLAVVNGVGYPNHSLSHFEAEAVWWAGTPKPFGTGWLGRFLDAALPLDVTHAISFGCEVNPTFAATSPTPSACARSSASTCPTIARASSATSRTAGPPGSRSSATPRDVASMVGRISRSGTT